MKRLIVNADDFGLAESINRGIALGHNDGILSSASLLANGPAFQDAAVLARQLPRLSLGVHLNLSQGKPLSPAIRVATLVNTAGNLYLTPPRLWLRIITGKITLEHIYCEFHAQIRRVFDSGITPTHLDAHMHVHVLPQLSPMLVSLAREFGIRYVRCPAEKLAATLPLLWKVAGPSLRAAKRLTIAYAVSSFAKSLRSKLRAAGLGCSDAFLGLAHTGFLDATTLRALLSVVPDGVTELICHPGYNDPAVKTFGGELTAEREPEIAALISSQTKDALNDLQIRLANFNDLNQNAASAQPV
jgi:hopanoid biosynthesis associated protein HpnK